MDKETAKKAKILLEEIEAVTEIRDAMGKEVTHWWAFISPDIKRRDSDGLCMSETLRKEFSIAVAATLAKLERDLGKL